MWRGLLLVAIFAGLSACPPKEDSPLCDGPEGPFALADYFPVAVGNSWSWRLYLSEIPGEERFVRLSLTMDDVLESNGCQVWHGVIEAPWYLLLGFTWLFGGEDSGYITAVGGSLHYTPDDPGAIDRIEALPSLEGWRLVPLHTDLSPRIEETLWDGEPFFIHYCSGYFPDALPPDTRLDLIPAEFYPAEPVVVTSTSEDGVVWKPSRMMLARGTGMLFGTTNMGHFYLHDLALNGETLEGY